MHSSSTWSTRLPSKIVSHPLLSAAEERAAFIAIADAREATWLVVLSDRRLAPRCLPSSSASLAAHVVWDSAREAAVMRPTRANLDAMADVAGPLARALAAADHDDEALHSAAAEVGRLAARASTPAAWVRRVGGAMAALAAAINHVEAHNARLVLEVARRYVGVAGGCMSVGDLFGYGCLGLRTAVLRFDVSKGFRFSTYATFWIRHAVRRSSQNLAREIRVPIHAIERAHKALREVEATADPTPEQLERARESRLAMRVGVPVSLYSPLPCSDGAEADVVLADRIADDAAPAADDALIDGERLDLLEHLLSTLDERARYVVEARFGMHSGDGEADKLKDVGAVLGLSRERVRQIADAAVVRLQAAARVALRGQQTARAVAPMHVGPVAGEQVSLAL